MKKTIVAFLLLSIFVYSYSQWKPTFGLEGGIGGGGMSSLLRAGNPLIVDNSALKKSWAYTGGAFLQIMRPSYGFEVKVDYSSFNAEAESFSTPENINLRYLSIPLLFKVRLSSKEGYSSGSWTDESYSLVGNTLYHTPSQYSAGGAFTTNVFLYVGAQYEILKKASHTFGTSTKTTEDIMNKLTGTGYSLVAGVEFTVNMLSFDFSYQKGMKTIDPFIDNNIDAFFVKIKFRLI